MEILPEELAWVAPHLEAIAGIAIVSTEGVVVQFTPEYAPRCHKGRVQLPLRFLGVPNTLVNAFLHELQHARDVLDGLELSEDEMEQRARILEASTNTSAAMAAYRKGNCLFEQKFTKF